MFVTSPEERQSNQPAWVSIMLSNCEVELAEVSKHELEQQTRRQLLIPTLEGRQSEKHRASQGCSYLQVDPSDDVGVTR